MEVSAISHIEPQNLSDLEAHAFITTLGFESRCTVIARKLEDNTFRKIALARTDHPKEFSFQENREYYQQHGYEIIPVETALPDLGVILRGMEKDKIRLIIDFTSMSQRWYYEVFRWFNDNPEGFEQAHLRFAYTMARYEELDQARKIRRIKPFLNSVPGSNNHKKKKALILGLGHEEHISNAIYRMVKPDLLYLMYADPPVDKKFVEKLFISNHALINSTSIRNLIAYPIRNGQSIYKSLTEIILPLRNDYNILMIPHGPKIFSIAAMLLQLAYPDIQISYPEFKKPPTVDRHPIDEPVVLDVLFEGEE